jgi:hypothetical protein
MQSSLIAALQVVEDQFKELQLSAAWREITTIPAAAPPHPVLRFFPRQPDELQLAYGRFLVSLREARREFSECFASMPTTEQHVADRRLRQLDQEARRIAEPQGI